MLLCNVAHLFINKLRIKYSCKPQSPGSALYIDSPVSLDDYLEAAENPTGVREIDLLDISAMPTNPQQILMIGLVRALIELSLVKFGAVLKDIDYRLHSAAQAIDSHPWNNLERAFAARNAVAFTPGQVF
jgi:hypothetical protein